MVDACGCLWMRVRDSRGVRRACSVTSTCSVVYMGTCVCRVRTACC
jgi:hypothetical protein